MALVLAKALGEAFIEAAQVVLDNITGDIEDMRDTMVKYGLELKSVTALPAALGLHVRPMTYDHACDILGMQKDDTDLNSIDKRVDKLRKANRLSPYISCKISEAGKVLKHGSR